MTEVSQPVLMGRSQLENLRVQRVVPRRAQTGVLQAERQEAKQKEVNCV